MAVYLFDSSAILKRYVSEVGSAWVNGIVAPTAANDVYLVRIAGAEVAAAIARRSKTGAGVTPAAARAVLARLRAEFASVFRLLEVDATLVDNAIDVAERYGLRGYDAVQLAGALKVRALCATTGASFALVSSDMELNAAAAAEGIRVEDPNAHP